MASNADSIIVDIHAQISGGADVKILSGLVSQLNADIRATGSATESQRAQLLATRNMIQTLAGGYAAGSAEAIKLSQAAASLNAQLGRVDAANIRALASQLAGVDANAAGAKTRLEGIVSAAQAAAGKFAAGSVEAQRLAQIIADAQRSINLINGRGIEDLEKHLKSAGTAGAQSRTQLEAVRVAALLMAQGFAAGSAEAQHLAAIIAGADAGLKRLTDAEKNAGLAAQIAQRALRLLSGEADSSTGGFSRLQASIVSVNSGLGILQQVTQGVQRIVSSGLGLVRLAGDMEQAQTAFTTMLGSGEKAKSFLADLADFAARTPFELVGLRDSSRRLLAYGFNAKDIIPVLTAVGNAVGSLGGGKDMLDGVTLAIGQIYAKGKVQAQEMNQLAERGIPAWKLLADKIGVSIPEAMKMAENGAISSATAIPAILEGLQKKFGGGMEAQSKTLLGMWSNTTDVLKQLGGEAGKYITEKLGLKDLLAQVNVNLGKIRAAFTGGGLEKSLDGVASKISQTLMPVFNQVRGAVVNAWSAIQSAYQTVLVPIFERIQPLVRRVWTEVPGIIQGAARLIEGAFNLIAQLWEHVLRPVWDALAPTIGGAITLVLRLLGGMLDMFGSTFKAISQLISGDWQGAADTMSGMWNRVGEAVGTAMGTVWEALKKIATNAFNKAKEVGLNIKDGIVAGTADLAARLGESVSNAIEKVKGYIPDWARDLLHIGKGNFVDDTVARAKGVAAGAREDKAERNAPTYGSNLTDMPQHGPQTVQGREQLVSLLGLGGARTGTPFGGTYFGNQIHNGEDLFAKTGQDVLAPFTGYLTTRWSKTTGHIAELIDAAGNKLLLGHLDKYADGIEAAIKKAGGKLLVQQGQLIAQVGQTGSLAHKDLGPGNAHIHAMGYRAGSDKAVEPFDIRYTSVRTPDDVASESRGGGITPASKNKSNTEKFDYSGVGGKAPVATLQDTLTARMKQAEDTFKINTRGLEKSSAGYQKAVDRYLATLNNVQKLAFDKASSLLDSDTSRSGLADIVQSTADKISGLSKSGGALAGLKKQIDDAKGVFGLYTKETPGYDKALDAYLAVLRKAATESKKLGDGLPPGDKKSAFGAFFTSTNSEIASLVKKDGLAEQLKRQLEDSRAALQRVSEDSPAYEKAVQTYIASLQKVQAAANKGISSAKGREQKNALSDLVASTRSEVDSLRAAGTDADKITEIVRQKSEGRAQSEVNTAKQSASTAQRSYELALKAAGDSATAKLAVQKNEGAALEAARETQAGREYDLAKVQASNTLSVALQAAAKGKLALRDAAEQLARQQNTLALQSAEDARKNALSSARDTQSQLLSQAQKAEKTSADAQLRQTLELQAGLRGVKKEALTQQLSDAVTQRDADLKNADGNLTEQLRIEQASGAKILAYQRQLAQVQRNEASRALDEKARVQKLSNVATYAGNSTGLSAANAAVDSATAAGKTNLQTAYLASLDGFGRVAAQRLKDVTAKIQGQENEVAKQLFADREAQVKTITDTVNGLFSGGGTIEQQAAGRSDALGLLAGALRGLLGVTADQASMSELSDVPALLTKLAAAGVDLSGVDFDSLGKLGELFQNLTVNSDQFLPVDQAKQFAQALRDLGGAAADVQLGLGDKKLSPTILSAYTALSSGDQASLQAVNSELAKIDPEKYSSLEALGLKVRAAIIKGAQDGAALTIEGQKGVVQQQLTQLDQNKDGLSAENYLSRRKALLEQSEALDYAAEQQRLDAAGASHQAYENAEVAHLRRLRGLNDDYNAGVLKADLDAARAHQQALGDLELQTLEGRHSRLEINEEDYINQRATRQLALAQQTKENSISDAGGLYGDPAKVQAAQDTFNASQLRITGEQQAALGQLTLSRAKQTQDSLASLEAASLAQRRAARLLTEEEASRETERLQIDAIDREEKRAKAAADKAGDVGASNEAGRVAEAARIQATSQGEAERQNIVLQRRQATEDALSKLEQAGVDQRHALKLSDDLAYSQEKEDIQLASIERQHQAALTAAGVDVDLQNAADRDAEAQRIALTSQGEAERNQIRLQQAQSAADALSKVQEAAINRDHALHLSTDLELSQQRETLQLASIERQHQAALTAAGANVDLQNVADREAEAGRIAATTQGEAEREGVRLQTAKDGQDALAKLEEAAVTRQHTLRLSTDLEFSRQREQQQLDAAEREHQRALVAAGVNVELQNIADRQAEAQSLQIKTQGEAERTQIVLQRQQTTEDALAKLEEVAAERRHTLGLSNDLEFSQEKETLQLAAIERQHQRALIAAGVDVDLQNAADREAEAASTQLTTQGEEERRVIRLNLRRAAEDAVTALGTGQEEARHKAGMVGEADYLAAGLQSRRMAAQRAYVRALEDAKGNGDKIKVAELALQTTLTQIDSDEAENRISLADKEAAAKVKAAQRDVDKGQGYNFSANIELQRALTEQVSNYRGELVKLDKTSQEYQDKQEQLQRAEDALRAARGEQINIFGRYADLLANVTGALGNLAGAMGQSEQDYDRFGKKLNTPWKDLAANVKGAENLFSKVSSMAGDVGKIIASGGADLNSWVSLVVKLGSSIADAIGGFQKAKAEVRKLKEDFKDANPYLNAGDYQKTSIRSKGWLADVFGGGPEVVNEIDKVGLKVASSFIPSVYNGIDGGFKKYLQSGNIEDFGKTLQASITGGIQQALIDGFKNAPDRVSTYARDTKRLTDALALPDSDPGKVEAVNSAIKQLGFDAKQTTKEAKGLTDALDAIDRESGTGRFSPEAIAAKQRDLQSRTLNNVQTALAIQNRAKLISDEEFQTKKRDASLAQSDVERMGALANENLSVQDRLVINEEFDLKRRGIQQDYLDWEKAETKKAADIERGIRLQALSNRDTLADAGHALALAGLSTDPKDAEKTNEQRRQIDSAYNADKLARTLERFALEREADLSNTELTAIQRRSINAKYDAQEQAASISAQAAELQAVKDAAQQIKNQREQTAQSWRQSLIGGVQALLSGDSPLNAMYKGVRDRVSKAIEDGFVVKRILPQLDPLFAQLDTALSKGLDAGGILQQIGAALPGLSVQIGGELGPLLGILNSAIPDLTKAVNGNTAAVKEIQYSQTTIVQSGQQSGLDSGLRARFARFA